MEVPMQSGGPPPPSMEDRPPPFFPRRLALEVLEGRSKGFFRPPRLVLNGG